MGLVVGDRAVEGVMLGDQPVTKLILGDQQVWPTGGGDDTYVADWSTEWGPEWTPVGQVESATAASGTAVLTTTNTNTSHAFMLLDLGRPIEDFDLVVTMSPSITNVWGGLVARWSGAAGAPSTLRIDLQNNVTLRADTAAQLYGGSRPVRVRVLADGSTVKAKAWDPDTSEPDTWGGTVTDSSAGGHLALWVGRSGIPLGNRQCLYSDLQLTVL